MFHTVLYSQTSLFKRPRSQALIKVLISFCANMKKVEAETEIPQNKLRCPDVSSADKKRAGPLHLSWPQRFISIFTQRPGRTRMRPHVLLRLQWRNKEIHLFMLAARSMSSKCTEYSFMEDLE